MAFVPLHFIGEAVAVEFDEPPIFAKTPGCPDRFHWQGQAHEVEALLSQWHDFGRRGRMAQNMQPEHLQMAAQRGSWGVGRFYFRVRTAGGQIFDLYYDRDPVAAGGRKGSWFLYRELAEDASGG